MFNKTLTSFQGWALYDFEKVEGEKGKSFSKCGKCLAILKVSSAYFIFMQYVS